LRPGSRITVLGLIRAHAGEQSVTGDSVLWVIESRQGRDVSNLVGPGSDLVMFDRGQDFEVVSNQRCRLPAMPMRSHMPGILSAAGRPQPDRNS
jgi:hypothetical protein